MEENAPVIDKTDVIITFLTNNSKKVNHKRISRDQRVR